MLLLAEQECSYNSGEMLIHTENGCLEECLTLFELQFNPSVFSSEFLYDLIVQYFTISKMVQHISFDRYDTEVC